MIESRLATISRRGLLLPAETREQIRATGIRCRPQLEVVYQQGAKLWKLRGEESGGAVELLGHYVGFVDSRGDAIPWLQRVQNFIPNGIHAIVVTVELVRVEMFRYEKTYDLLITKHWLERNGDRRPELRSAILFLGRNGSLETELWGKDSAFRGGAMPHFYTRSGEPGGPASMWLDSVMKVTEGACCPACRHSHLLEVTASSSGIDSELLVAVPALSIATTHESTSDSGARIEACSPLGCPRSMPTTH